MDGNSFGKAMGNMILQNIAIGAFVIGMVAGAFISTINGCDNNQKEENIYYDDFH